MGLTGQHKRLALGRLKAGEMNLTEKAYAAVLEQRRIAGEVLWYKFEGIKFRLADKAFYTPDFVVMLDSGLIQCHEVKGKWEDDAKVKIKVAASIYPFDFVAVRKQSKAAGGGFSEEWF